METKDFVKATIKALDEKNLEALKEKLVGEYIKFSFVDESRVNADVFAEKMSDYFEKLELKTGDKFEKICQKYTENLDDVVKRYIPKEPSAKKGEPAPPMLRSTKYYKHAHELKNSRSMTMRQLADFSRIMMSLYMDSIKNGMKEVKDYTFSTESIELDRIISSFKAEKPVTLSIRKKTMFDLADLYSTDTATFIITMIMFYYIKTKEVKGEE